MRSLVQAEIVDAPNPLTPGETKNSGFFRHVSGPMGGGVDSTQGDERRVVGCWSHVLFELNILTLQTHPQFGRQ